MVFLQSNPSSILFSGALSVTFFIGSLFFLTWKILITVINDIFGNFIIFAKAENFKGGLATSIYR